MSNTTNLIEKIDSKTFKQLCIQCGGKGYFFHNWVDIDTNKIYKKEIVSCNCENGFKYGPREIR